jgi:amino acid transporter
LLQPYSTYYAIVLFSLISLTNGFAVFFPGRFTAADFVTSYLPIPIFVALYFGHRFWQKTSGAHRIEDIDLFGGLEEVEEITATDVAPVPANIWEKIWYWIC